MRTSAALAAACAFIYFAAPAPAHAALRTDDRSEAARFAADAVALHGSGFHLADLIVDVDSDEDGLTTVTMVLAHDDVAVSLSLELADYGQRVFAYHRAPADAPGEHRIYPGEQALFDQLAQTPFDRLVNECESWSLSDAEGSAWISLDESDWYVPAGAWTGAEAQRALARELGAMDQGWELAAATTAWLDDGTADRRHLEIVLTKDQARTLRVELDARGNVIALERRDSPLAWQSGTLAGSKALGKSLRAAKRIARIEISGDDERTFTFVPAKAKGAKKAKGIVVETAEIESYDGECGC